ncbi:MAG: helix-turn-helix domain-containing protein [Spirochaetaceae bacterium]|nr:helix-turn-helix domain-containing protein [Spirochaetaceae bacterium]
MEKKYKGKLVYKIEMDQLKKQYKVWKNTRRELRSPFYVVYTDFQDTHLKDISGGALKLYIYLGFQVNTFTGECWHSVESIADFFENDPRTVRKWFKELEERKLIKRIQNGFKRVANTFFLPYGDGVEDND